MGSLKLQEEAANGFFEPLGILAMHGCSHYLSVFCFVFLFLFFFVLLLLFCFQGTYAVYFNLSNTFTKVKTGEFSDSAIVRAAIVSQKFLVLTIVFNRNVSLSVVSLFMGGERDNITTDIEVRGLDGAHLHSLGKYAVHCCCCCCCLRLLAFCSGQSNCFSVLLTVNVQDHFALPTRIVWCAL